MNAEIIELIKQRLEVGKREYQQEVDPFDGRNWEIEALEEILDGMVYTATSILKLISNQVMTEGEKNEKYYANTKKTKATSEEK